MSEETQKAHFSTLTPLEILGDENYGYFGHLTPPQMQLLAYRYIHISVQLEACALTMEMRGFPPLRLLEYPPG